jgi:magnesium transporter
VVAPDTDQEHVANAALRHGLTAVPVADESGRFLGIVPARALLDIIQDVLTLLIYFGAVSLFL